jgi:carboxyl-terminal processing protease
MENMPDDKILEEQKLYRKKLFQNYLRLLVLVLFCAATFGIGFEKGKINSNSAQQIVPISNAIFENKDNSVEKSIDFSLFWKVWDILKNKYVDSSTLDANKLFYGAIKGMMQATGDPYTTFFDPEENKEFNEDITGTFEGIGAELGIKNGILTVIAPLEGTPAQLSGLRSGDKIIKINGKIASDMNIEEAVDNIRGPKGTSVVLTIFREGSEETQDVTVQRNVINVKSVTVEFDENNLATIKIIHFGDDTEKGFADAMNKVKNKNSKGLIIDLRNNPGGYLESAVEIASQLLPKGKVVVIEEDQSKKQNKTYSRGGDVGSGIETIVLINEGSASASEILAGALRENRENVALIGKKSFGKGSVQEMISLPHGTAAKITVARWLTPNGEQINEQGIKPDKEIGFTEDDYNNIRDPQMEAAKNTLKEKAGIK